ncbi:hypothetical protein ACOME3_009713 [Neoechinorhynchus agilis]
MDSKNRIILNVGGTRYETYRHTLKKIPATRLSRLTEALSNYDPILNEYFFDRHPGVFQQILNYYRTGKLHYPTNVCGPLFETELEFWGLDSNQVEPCCWMTYTKHRATQETLATLDKIELDEISTMDDMRQKFGWDEFETFARLPWYQRCRPFIWQLFDEPHSSVYSKVLTAISLFFVLLSVFVFVAESVPELHDPMGTTSKKTDIEVYGPKNYIQNTGCTGLPFERNQRILESDHLPSMNQSLDRRNLSLTPPTDIRCDQLIVYNRTSVQRIECAHRLRTFLRALDITSNIYLLIEVVLKILVCPSVHVFFKSTINAIDCFASCWYFGNLAARTLLPTMFNQNYAFNLLSNVRILRIFKICRHHTGLRVIVASLRSSAQVLWLFILFITLGMMIYATLIYYAERVAYRWWHAAEYVDPSLNATRVTSTYSPDTNDYNTGEDDKRSIFDWWWFSIITASTVGYGDVCPRSLLGKLFGFYCAVSGVIVTDLPMAIIVQTFTDFYKHQSARSKLPRKRRRVQTGDSTVNATPGRLKQTKDPNVVMSPEHGRITISTAEMGSSEESSMTAEC